ncbi:hypothetical protein I5907_20090 [Panacibacter sp. DH6]|uniref:Uncharacterized protein n=1 Tax=Panacibacter microcysteis TaxID=2793269 RepID=A0A931MDE7_9BACT|nr:hypothetical protein [Panacibacter microcysteis]MBG9378547.1 hypothetical protein [Panacibacter microcysteis]
MGKPRERRIAIPVKVIMPIGMIKPTPRTNADPINVRKSAGICKRNLFMPVFYLLKPTQQDLRVEHLLISGGAKVIRMLLAVTSLQSATRKDRECLLCYRQ